MSTPVLSLQNLSGTIQHRVLFQQLNAHLYAGRLTAITGPSGCGKTTLLRIVAGLIDPTGGGCLLQGRYPDCLGWPLYRRQVMLVQQAPVMLEGSVETNLRRPFAYHTIQHAFDRQQAVDLLQAMRLDPDTILPQHATSLSQGQQQRVSLVRALLLHPKVLLLDEPTSALDESATTAVEDLLRTQSHNSGLAALIITHDHTQAWRWCDQELDLTLYQPKGMAHA